MPDLWKSRRQRPTKTNSKFNSAIRRASRSENVQRLQERIRDLSKRSRKNALRLPRASSVYNELERKYQDLLLRDLS